jgi:hypothetical protein
LEDGRERLRELEAVAGGEAGSHEQQDRALVPRLRGIGSRPGRRRRRRGFLRWSRGIPTAGAGESDEQAQPEKPGTVSRYDA